MSNHDDSKAIKGIIASMPTSKPIAGRMDEAYWIAAEAADLEARADNFVR